MMKNTIPFLLLFSLITSCENELHPVLYSKPIPVVYALLDGGDSMAMVKLTRTFTLENGFFEQSIPDDSLSIESARVWLERWNGEYLYVRAELQKEDIARVPGNFPGLPNPVYRLPLNEQTAPIFAPPVNPDLELVKLIIDIPDYSLIYGQIKPLPAVKIMIPREGSRLNLFGSTGLEIRWNNKFQEYIYYTEGFVGFEYTDHYENTDSVRSVRWRDYHADASFLSSPPFVVRGDDFLRRLAFYIHDDPKVIYRTVNHISISIYWSDENFYDYTQRILVSPIDQTGLPYSNLVNAIGIFSAISTSEKHFLPDYYSLSQISTSETTAHLKFVSW